MASPESKRIRATFVNDSETLDVPLAVQRREWEAGAAKIPMLPGITIETVSAEGVSGEWVRSAGAASDIVMLFLHGGGFSTGSCITHRDMASRISLAAGIPVLTVDYRLVPEHPFPAGLGDAATAYRWLMKTGYAAEHIVIGGDSSGGGLTLSALLMLRDAGDPLPAAAVLMSPMLDLALEGESIKTRVTLDPLISPQGLEAAARLYTGERDPKEPLLSPIYADLHDLPPLLIQVGDHEILLSDSLRLADWSRAAGGEVQLDVWPEMWHVFQAWAPELPEAQEAIRQIGQYVSEKLNS